MKQLSNNCRIGKISVFPKDWKTVRANVNITWYIKYRFYDDNIKRSKQVVIKGMNEFSTLKGKQVGVITLLNSEIADLENGLNKFTNQFFIDENSQKDISEKNTVDFRFRICSI